MSKKKNRLWSVTRIRHPRHPGITIRVTELKPGRNLYAVRLVDGKQRMASLGITRRDLGSTAREQEEGARLEAFGIIEDLANGPAAINTQAPMAKPGASLTLTQLADMYEVGGFYGKSQKYKTEQPKKVRRVVAFIIERSEGHDRDVRTLCQVDLDAYAAHRESEGAARGTIWSDIAALNIALNWAVKNRNPNGQGEAYLSANPLAGTELGKLYKEPKPRRPVAGADRYKKLKGVADRLPPQFGLALDLVWATGHRIGAVARLQWDHVILDPELAAALARELDAEVTWTAEDFPLGGIHWYAGERSDNKKHPHVSPMSALAHDALKAYGPDIWGPGWILQAPKDPTKPVGYHVLKRWLSKAERLAELEPQKGSAWHAFRRGWATARKHIPSKDAAKAGGWKDEATMQRCYVRAEGSGILAAVNGG